MCALLRQKEKKKRNPNSIGPFFSHVSPFPQFFFLSSFPSNELGRSIVKANLTDASPCQILHFTSFFPSLPFPFSGILSHPRSISPSRISPVPFPPYHFPSFTEPFFPSSFPIFPSPLPIPLSQLGLDRRSLGPEPAVFPSRTRLIRFSSRIGGVAESNPKKTFPGDSPMCLLERGSEGSFGPPLLCIGCVCVFFLLLRWLPDFMMRK